MASTDAVFYIEEDFWPHNTSLFVTSFHGNLPRWCYYLLRSISKADHSGKSAVPGVDRKDLFDIVVAVPPSDEQSDIVEGIESRTRQLNGMTSQVEREIALIQEFRTRLIADVVTGKLDVRELAASIPETVEPVPVEGPTEDEDLDEVTEEAEAEEIAA